MVFPRVLTAHDDGKIRQQWGVKSDFLALCVTGPGMEKEKLLGDIPLPKGTGKNMADATFQLFLAWKVENNIVAFGFDTTLSMTGPDKGVCE